MIVAIIQPSFLPWLGYLEQVARADLFVYFDDVQYTKKDWRNRNRFKGHEGKIEFLSVPVTFSLRDKTLIKDVPIADQPGWQEKMLSRLKTWYRFAPAFDEVFPEISRMLMSDRRRLVDLDIDLTAFLLGYLEIATPTALSSSVVEKSTGRNLRIIDICRHFGATTLYDGASAANFIDVELFKSAGINVVFQEYRPIPYPQVGGGPFISHLSTLDTVFNCGKDAREVLLASPVPPSLPPRSAGCR